MCAIGNPIFDISYCLYSSGLASSFNNLDKSLTTYHKSLSETLEKFDLDADQCYSFNTLKQEWKDYCIFGFGMTLFVSRLKLREGDILDMTKYNGTKLEPFKIPIEQEGNYKENMRDLVLHMCNHNFL